VDLRKQKIIGDANPQIANPQIAKYMFSKSQIATFAVGPPIATFAKSTQISVRKLADLQFAELFCEPFYYPGLSVASQCCQSNEL
jgi:hypothetical protein